MFGSTYMYNVQIDIYIYLQYTYIIRCIYSIQIQSNTYTCIYIYHLKLYLLTVSTPCCTHAGWWFWNSSLNRGKAQCKATQDCQGRRGDLQGFFRCKSAMMHRSDEAMIHWRNTWHISIRKLICPRNNQWFERWKFPKVSIELVPFWGALC